MSGPLYLQIAENMRSSVANGLFLPGQALPPERELMEQFSVSRVTVRRALKELVNESILESRQGSGYIVQSLSHLNQPLNRVTSFSEDCVSRGLKPGSVLIGRKLGKSSAEESAHFDVPQGSKVLRVKRIRTGNGEPLLVEHATLLATKAPDWPWPEGSLYLAMQGQGLIPVRVQQQYVPALADKTLAKRLDVPKGSPLMLVIRAGYSADDAPVEYSHCWFRPDRWTFANEIRR
ncbi:MAG: GntR family transcriptional regulator [Granulosicoccaceae bacterium]